MGTHSWCGDNSEKLTWNSRWTRVSGQHSTTRVKSWNKTKNYVRGTYEYCNKNQNYHPPPKWAKLPRRSGRPRQRSIHGQTQSSEEREREKERERERERTEDQTEKTPTKTEERENKKNNESGRFLFNPTVFSNKKKSLFFSTLRYVRIHENKSPMFFSTLRYFRINRNHHFSLCCCLTRSSSTEEHNSSQSIFAA